MFRQKKRNDLQTGKRRGLSYLLLSPKLIEANADAALECCDINEITLFILIFLKMVGYPYATF